MPDREAGQHEFQSVTRLEPQSGKHHLAGSGISLGRAVAGPVADRAGHDLEHLFGNGRGQRLAERVQWIIGLNRV